jgi:hypothetical protein
MAGTFSRCRVAGVGAGVACTGDSTGVGAGNAGAGAALRPVCRELLYTAARLRIYVPIDLAEKVPPKRSLPRRTA